MGIVLYLVEIVRTRCVGGAATDTHVVASCRACPMSRMEGLVQRPLPYSDLQSPVKVWGSVLTSPGGSECRWNVCGGGLYRSRTVLGGPTS